jgi:hypothetical protein
VNALRATRPLDIAAQHVGVDGVLSDIRSSLDETNAAIVQHTSLPPGEPTAPAPEAPAAAPSEPAPKAPAS